MTREVRIKVNGVFRAASVSPETTLLELLRQAWGLTGAKLGCGAGDCGTCTVLLEGRPVNACLLLAVKADEREVMTIEGLGALGHLHPLQRVFEQQAALQCGFCGPGMILSAKALLDANPDPSELEVRDALAGNLCRCTGYTRIVAAVLDAGRRLRGAGPGHEHPGQEPSGLPRRCAPP